jgi:outer membrane PBP1 activator LpoA protein
VSEDCQKLYLAGLSAPYEESALPELEKAIKLAGDRQAELRLMGARDLMRAGANVQARALLENGPVDAEESGILYADLLLGLKEFNKADSQIQKMAGQNHSRAARAQILYLQARLLRDTDREEEAVRFFRLAARYASGELASRYVSLAAFSLYRLEHPIQARALMKGVELPANRNIKLLAILLAVEVDGDRRAGQSLRRLLPSIRQIPPDRRSFLENKAILLEGHPAL